MNPTNGPNLRDIHAAAAPSWWPPAPGWWLLVAIVVALLIFVSLFAIRKIRLRNARRRLLAEFDRAVDATRDQPPLLAATLSRFLRRAQLLHSPRAATLSGNAWLEHLDQQSGSNEFSVGVGRALVDAPYRAHADFDAPALIALARRNLRYAIGVGRKSHV